MKTNYSIPKGKKLTEEQVNLLYTKEPTLNDPNYFLKTVLRRKGETITFLILVDSVKYICVSNPNKNDIWYIIN